MASTDDVIRALLPVADSLDRIGVPYMIGGSVASSVLGVARANADRLEPSAHVRVGYFCHGARIRPPTSRVSAR